MVQDVLQPEEVGVCKVLILTGSWCLIEGISRLIWKWKKPEYRKAKRKPVNNGDLFEELGKLVHHFEDQGTLVVLALAAGCHSGG
jgi:ribonuclease HI